MGKRFISIVTGSRGAKTGKKLEQPESIVLIATDYWKAYKRFILDDKPIQSKAETFTVEGYDSLFPHFLARLRRKSKC